MELGLIWMRKSYLMISDLTQWMVDINTHVLSMDSTSISSRLIWVSRPSRCALEEIIDPSRNPQAPINVFFFVLFISKAPFRKSSWSAIFFSYRELQIKRLMIETMEQVNDQSSWTCNFARWNIRLVGGRVIPTWIAIGNASTPCNAEAWD